MPAEAIISSKSFCLSLGSLVQATMDKALGTVVPAALQKALPGAFEAAFQKAIIPAFEAACQTMFKEVRHLLCRLCWQASLQHSAVPSAEPTERSDAPG